jgi:uncharacterized protein (TIGR00730 family)
MTTSPPAWSLGDKPRAICVFCGSSPGRDAKYMQAAEAFGVILAKADVKLVYGGGGVGLMGGAARAAHHGGGKVFGVMPDFLRRHEVIYDEVETAVVATMHDRKRMMFENAEAFVILPGGVGTLEEVVELMSWRRLDLHRKPIVFLNLDDFWTPLFALMDHMEAQAFAPAWLKDTWSAVDTVEAILPSVMDMRSRASAGPGFFGYAAAALHDKV